MIKSVRESIRKIMIAELSPYQVVVVFVICLLILASAVASKATYEVPGSVGKSLSKEFSQSFSLEGIKEVSVSTTFYNSAMAKYTFTDGREVDKSISYPERFYKNDLKVGSTEAGFVYLVGSRLNMESNNKAHLMNEIKDIRLSLRYLLEVAEAENTAKKDFEKMLLDGGATKND